MKVLLDALFKRKIAYAVLAENGVIAELSPAWDEFAGLTGLHLPNSGIGYRYLDICATGPRELLQKKLGSLMAGTARSFTFLFQSNGPAGKRWYLIIGIRGNAAGLDFNKVLVFHVPLTALLAPDSAGGLIAVVEQALAFRREEIIVGILRSAVVDRFGGRLYCPESFSAQQPHTPGRIGARLDS